MEDLHLTTWEEATLEYSSSFKEYIANHPLQEQVAGLSEQELANNFNGFILGVDGETLEAYQNTLGEPIDREAFERGEIALIATDQPEVFSSIQHLTIFPCSREGSSLSDRSEITLSLGGFVPFDYKGVGASLAPTIVVSNTAMQKWFGDPAAL